LCFTAHTASVALIHILMYQVEVWLEYHSKPWTACPLQQCCH